MFTLAGEGKTGKRGLPGPHRTRRHRPGALRHGEAPVPAGTRDELERRALRDPSSYDEMIEYLRKAAGFVAARWCGRRECEELVKDDCSATIRCLPLGEQPAQLGDCICCGRSAVTAVVWAQAY